jgi:hypothetical protein
MILRGAQYLQYTECRVTYRGAVGSSLEPNTVPGATGLHSRCKRVHVVTRRTTHQRGASARQRLEVESDGGELVCRDFLADITKGNPGR